MPAKTGGVMSNDRGTSNFDGVPSDWASRLANLPKRARASQIKRKIRCLRDAEKAFCETWPLLQYQDKGQICERRGKAFRTWHRDRQIKAAQAIELLREAAGYLEQFLRPGRPVDLLLDEVKLQAGRLSKKTADRHKRLLANPQALRKAQRDFHRRFLYPS